VLVAVYAYAGTEETKPISAGKVSPKERRAYEEK
jgi:uncharacterized DUF497 family protein